MFTRAKNVTIKGGSFGVNAGSPSSSSRLDKLVAEVAPNAILNAGGRADEVRCYPGTREEVIGRLEKFMNDDNPNRKRMVWLSGPAGAGESAICQTVAERCSEQGQQAANFFFFRADNTRSHSKPLVATLVYQLRRFYPALDHQLSDYLATDPLICSASIETQFKQLISSPFEIIQRSKSIREQIVIIIDGLDECNDKRDQDQILISLRTLAYADHSPFLILVSSRAEPHLVMSFNRLGSAVASIFLNEDYKPQKDIRLFVVAKFAEIKNDHHLARTLGENWPTRADIDAIVDKSSGQFIYAATVMRYIQFSSSSPALSLVIILEMPPSTDHNPLAHLDAVYSYIFSKVHNIREVKLILLAKQCAGSEFRSMLRLVGYKDVEVESYFADLGAIIKVQGSPGLRVNIDQLLEFYHASLEDYLTNKSRSAIYCVNENHVAAELTSMCLRNIHNPYPFQLTLKPLYKVQKPTPELSKSLLDASTKQIGCYPDVIILLDDLISHIEFLYWEHDLAQFKALLLSWSCFVRGNNLDGRYWGPRKIQPKNPSASQYYEQYWMTSTEGHGYHGQEPQTSPNAALSGAAKSVTDFHKDHLDFYNKDVPLAPLMNAVSGPSRAALGHQAVAAGPARGIIFSIIHKPLKSLRRKVTPRRPRGTIGTEEREEGHGRREYDDDPYKLSMIRVKFHYQDDIRGMTLAPDTPFSEFVVKVTAKFGNNFNNLTMKFEDEDGARITLRDNSDYEHAIETVRKRNKGKAKSEAKLEIWCEDNVMS